MAGAALVLLLLCVSALTWPPVAVAQAAAKSGIAVMPFVDRRGGVGEWLAAFLARGIHDSLLEKGRFGVMSLDNGAIWRESLGLGSGAPPESGDVARMGVDYAIGGEVHRVLTLARVKIHLTAADPENQAERIAWELEFDLRRDSPRDVLTRVMAHLLPSLTERGRVVTDPPEMPDVALQPGAWGDAEAFYSLPPLGDLKDFSMRVLAGAANALERFAATPGLEAKVAGRRGELLLIQALLHVEGRAARASVLSRALEGLDAAVAGEEWNTRWIALKAETLYHLKRDYLAKREASVARIRNPLEGLAYLVLGLTAGLSTAGGNDWMVRALRADPLLRAANRPPGTAPFQGGALEPYFETWDRLQARKQNWNSPEYERQVKLGQSFFDERRWEEATTAFEIAAAMDGADHLPSLYLGRIESNRGKPEAAEKKLSDLVAEFPQEWEVWHHLGLAQKDLRRFDMADHSFRRALEEHPGRAESLYQLATVLILREQWESAQATLQRYLRHNADDAEGWILLGISATHLENWPRAAGAFERAVGLDPRSDLANAGLANAKSHLK